MDKINYWGIVPAAGMGKRMGAAVPKQYLELGGKPIIQHTLERLLSVSQFESIVVAVSQDDRYWPELPAAHAHRVHTTLGGKERADSVLAALHYLEERAAPLDWVLVHDAARPLVARADIRLLIETLQDDSIGGLLALPVHDTLKAVEGGRIVETIDRSRIWRALTPQMFRYGALKAALRQAAERGAQVTDEASALELQGKRPRIVEGRADNIKITRAEDLALAAFYLERQC